MKYEKGETVIDIGSDGLGEAIETVVDTTANSICITQTATSYKGINCTQWLSEKQIKERIKSKR